MDVNPPNRHCSTCGTAFLCGSDAGHCWCADLPPIMAIAQANPNDPPNTGCLCRRCLSQRIAARIHEHLAQHSFEENLALASTHANNGPLIEHIDYTIENGRWIFSRWFLLKRGLCCGEGSRHCPYP